MSKLRKRMIQDMQLRGLSPRTQVSYAQALRQLALHYHKAPDRITQEELRDYFLFRKKHLQWSTSAPLSLGKRYLSRRASIAPHLFLEDNGHAAEFANDSAIEDGFLFPGVVSQAVKCGLWIEEQLPRSRADGSEGSMAAVVKKSVLVFDAFDEGGPLGTWVPWTAQGQT